MNNRQTKAIQSVVVLTILASLVYGSLLFWQPLWLFHRRDLRDGNLIVRQVGLFRHRKGRLPDTLEAMNLNALSDQVFYRKIDANHHEVWFSIALGESEIYDSATKQWQ